MSSGKCRLLCLGLNVLTLTPDISAISSFGICRYNGDKILVLDIQNRHMKVKSIDYLSVSIYIEVKLGLCCLVLNVGQNRRHRSFRRQLIKKFGITHEGYTSLCFLCWGISTTCAISVSISRENAILSRFLNTAKQLRCVLLILHPQHTPTVLLVSQSQQMRQ